MPQHLLGDVPPAELRQHPFGTETPTGNGPFRFVEHRAGDRWVYEANPAFPDALGGRPYFDRLVYRYIEEPTTRLAEFLTGEVDVYLIVAPAQVAEIEATPGARIVSYANRNYAFINWNGRRPLFQDARVRRALTLAIDRQEIVDAVQRGLGQVAKSSVPPSHWAHHTDLPPIAYDPDSARLLLDAAGWLDHDGDGVRDKDGIAASFELTTNPNPTREDILTLVQSDLKQVGIDVRTRVQESQSLGANITSPERSFDAFVLGWQTEFNPIAVWTRFSMWLPWTEIAAARSPSGTSIRRFCKRTSRTRFYTTMCERMACEIVFATCVWIFAAISST
jgi:peptide/nickel transport system substrate-binding protein